VSESPGYGEPIGRLGPLQTPISWRRDALSLPRGFVGRLVLAQAETNALPPWPILTRDHASQLSSAQSPNRTPQSDSTFRAGNEAPDPYIQLDNLSKRYGGVVALSQASFACRLGEVHALVGENGAGKSTLVKIVAGIVKADSGSIHIGHRRQPFSGPGEAIGAGIGSVFQELSLCPDLTVGQSIFSNALPTGPLRTVSRRALREACEALFSSMGVAAVNPDRPVRELSLQQRQLVEIAKVASRQPRIYVFDEASSALGQDNAEWLLSFARRLAGDGKAVIYISHKLHEVLEVADRITVFRNGRHVGTSATTETTADELVELMLGRPMERLYPPRAGAVGSDIALEARNLATEGKLSDVSFSVLSGEILGVGGLAGQGQEELFRCLFGVEPPDSGQLSIAGHPVRVSSPRDALGRGIALVPADRANEGLLLSKPVSHNVSLAALSRVTRVGLIGAGLERRLVQEYVTRLGIRVGSIGDRVNQLSGGNQQKVVIAKLLATRPRVLLLFDCTRGVDVGTKAELFFLLRQLASEGTAILLYSTDTDELVNMCDRVIVLRGRTVGSTIERGDLSAESIVRASLGAASKQALSTATDHIAESNP
jgi:ribose transport system ATP-binding protein